MSSSSSTASPDKLSTTIAPLTFKVSVKKVTKSGSSSFPTTPLFTTRLLSNLIIELSPGIIFISPSDKRLAGTPHWPDPSPSEIHDCPIDPGELIPYSTFSEDKTPSSVRSVKFESKDW